ncbi:unnamed protein product [Symbiodinium pilosum]|uniref:Uncharacterized protein n=1 Tax=Symbiodinium pilosum TaxID=2952 RepID=A0A812LGX1_SYMPI|nr:unnamed protein product [Symbiodinium pilosum]
MLQKTVLVPYNKRQQLLMVEIHEVDPDDSEVEDSLIGRLGTWLGHALPRLSLQLIQFLCISGQRSRWPIARSSPLRTGP